MKVDHTDIDQLRAYKERLMRALEEADYLSPVVDYQRELLKVQKEIAALEAKRR